MVNKNKTNKKNVRIITNSNRLERRNLTKIYRLVVVVIFNTKEKLIIFGTS